MIKIVELSKKAKKHFEEKGILGGIRWLFFAIRFRTMLFLTKRHVAHVKKEGNLNKKVVPKDHIRKNMHNVFVFSMIPYYDIGGGQRPAQLVKAFSMLGYNVYYFFGMDTSESIVYDMEIPTIVHENIENYSEVDFEATIQKDDLVIVEFAYEKFMPFLKIAKKRRAKIVYENIDNWETSLGSQLFKRENLNKVLKLADLLVGTAEFLVRQLKGYCKELSIDKPIIYNPNAVNDVLFNPKHTYEKPKDFVDGEKVLTYYGSLWGDWFDWDLLYGTAKAFPKYSFLMIGEKENIRNITDKAPKNVHFLGIKQQTDLPAYLQYSNYALIPFKVDKIGEAVSPLKIFEYISMNKIVLSTKMPEVLNYPNTLCGDTVAEWTKLLKKKTKVDVEARNEFIEKNNWYSRSLEIASSVGLKFDSFKEKISIIILNHNNKECIGECIESILRHSKSYKYEIVVVDNKSTDGSYELLKKKYGKKITLVKNDKNGCSSGRNLGVSVATGKYLLFLDSDQFVNRDEWLNPFVEVLKQDNVGAVGWAAGWNKKNKHGFMPIVDDYPYRGMPANMLARFDIDYIGSGGMFLEKKIFEEIGGFDERYDPTCFEDTDFSFAIKNAGYRIAYSPYLGVYHVPHQTTKNGELEHEKLLEEHRKIFFEKWGDKL